MHAQAATLWGQRMDAELERSLPAGDEPRRRLHAAMRHAALLGGKRMRPLLVYATGTAFGADLEALDAPALAVELVHAYSLVHDDLPAMDDDALRRGQPTVHVVFDEATRSEEHTSELQSLMRISYAVFCLKKKTQPKTQ